nr:heavy-metal-associated domain-containing protein [Fusobacterium gastrosuis]
MKKVIKIDGMGCEHCIKSVREALGAIEGLIIHEVRLGEATVDVADESILKKVAEELDDAGYEVLE